MSAVIQKQIPKNTFGLICTICEQDEPILSHRLLPYFKNRGSKKLLDLGVMENAANSNTCPDHKGDDYPITYKDNIPGFYKNDVWHQVSYDNIKMYRLNINSLISIISKDLAVEYDHEVIIKDFFYRIGTLKISKTNVPIFFARRIQFQKILEDIYNAINKRSGINKGVILTSSSYLPFGCSKLLGHEVISLKDCMIHDSKNYHIDLNIIKSLIGFKGKKEGFSNGYRTGYFDGIDYKFTKKQAAVIEALDKHGGKINKYELLAEADSEQYDLFRIFRNSKGIYHPAWNLIIKNDNKGNYWLEY